MLNNQGYLWKTAIDWSPSFRFEAGMKLFAAGAAARHIYFINQGLVKLTLIQQDGRETVIALRKAGEMVGYTASILNSSYTGSASAVTVCDAARIDAWKFQKEVLDNTQARLLLIREQANEAQDLAAELIAMKFFTAQERARRFFRQFGETTSSPHAGEHRYICPKIKEQDIADLIGVSKQHFSTMKRIMLAAGQLVEHDGTLTFCDTGKWD